MVFGVRSIRVFTQFSLDPYYEPLPWFMIIVGRYVCMRVYRYGGTYNITCVFMCMRIPSFNWVNVAKNAWFAPAKRPRCYPVRVLGFDQPDFQGFTNQSSRIFCQSEHWGLFFQLECWGFTSRSAGVLPAGVLGFYQPECWGFTSRSAGVLPDGVLGFYQPEC